MKTVDLHVHSYKSDGSLSPTQLVDMAIEKNLSALALTDHDTMNGIPEIMAAASAKNKEGYDLEIIPGVEFSTEYLGKDIHILGLFLDCTSPTFTKKMEEFSYARVVRNQKMCEKLTEHGIPLTYEILTTAYPGSVITRAHYATYMLEHGYVKSMKEAFERYIGDYAPCFIPREKVTPMDAIHLILQAKGLPILAHPILYRLGNQQLEVLISTLKEAGLVGIEAIYSTYTQADERHIRKLAKKYNLLISGGSDFHGTPKPDIEMGTGYGKLFIPYDVLTDLKQKRKELHHV